ncbi:MAG: AAA family ATPase [Patescibacteria group bacterium]|nr:AAA family ATPase [Patescibacteria group bacterium]
MPYRIGFIGAGGTGKTSVLELLKPFLEEQNIKVRPSVVRGVLKDLNLTEKDLSSLSLEQGEEVQRHLFFAKEAQDRAAVLSGENFITDRTLLDHYVYWLYRGGKAIRKENLENFLLGVSESLSTYSKLFYFPVYATWEPPDDGFREEGYIYRKTIDFLMSGVAGTIVTRNYKLAAKISTVPDTPPSQRKVWMEGILRNQGMGQPHFMEEGVL